MTTMQRILTVLWAALTRALQFWARDIARRKTLTSKALSGCLGLFVILCACSTMLAAVQGAGEAVGLLPTRTPAAAPTARPTVTATPLVVAAPTVQALATTAAAPTTPPPTIAPATAAPAPPTEASAPAPPAETTAPAQPIVINAPAASPLAAPPAPQAPSSSQAVAGDAPMQPEGLPSGPVTRVVDGDTVDVSLDGRTVRVRLIGIDTPETVDPRTPVECFGGEASAKAHEPLDGQTVLLEDDPSQDSVDRYGRALRYAWLSDGRLFNLEMVAQGYAFEYTYNLPYKYQAQFKQAERDAREQQRGLWAPSACNGEHRPADELPGTVATSAPATVAPAQAPTPTNAPSGGVTITRAPGTVRRGATATVAAHTAPGAQCSILVRYKSGPSKAQGLGPKTADEGGDVSWAWKVGTNTTPGAWPVTITCGGAAARKELVVP